MTLLKKPKQLTVFYSYYEQISYLKQERDYYKAVAELAVGALHVIRMACPTIEDADTKAMLTLEAIRQTEQPT